MPGDVELTQFGLAGVAELVEHNRRVAGVVRLDEGHVQRDPGWPVRNKDGKNWKWGETLTAGWTNLCMNNPEYVDELAAQAIEALNAVYPLDQGGPFFLFHRPRTWNGSEGVWMGWERKRGKIEEWNRLLRGATDTSFTVEAGDASVFPAVRYCITLDSDTRLPRDAAKKLIGIAAHPLNQPQPPSESCIPCKARTPASAIF